MAAGQADHLLQHLRRLARPADEPDLADSDLLRLFTGQHDQDAFAALLRRHGPMVFGVCRRVLGNRHDAEDAFQATFLILARRAGSIRRGDSVAPWLYGTAYRVALKARAAAARRERRERQAPERPPADPLADLSVREAQALLDAELRGLPEAYRAPLVLCYLEENTQDEAARRLGWAKGTLRRRLERGRELLRARLARRGLTLTAALCAAALAPRATSAAVPAALAQATARAVAGLAAGRPVAAAAAAPVARLVDGSHALLARWPATAALLLLAGALAAGAALLAQRQGQPGAEEGGEPQPAAGAAEKRQADDEAAARVDRFGDPLPTGAVARLGSLRFYHGDDVQNVALSPDGKLAVSVSRTRTRLWDAATGEELRAGDELQGASFFPGGGKLMAVKGEKDGIHVWDVAGHKEVSRLPLVRQFGTFGLSPDGKTLVVWSPEGGGQSSLRFCDVTAGAVGEPVGLKNGEQVRQFAFSADGKTLVARYLGLSAHVWDTATRTERLASPPSAGGALGEDFALSPDGRTLATAFDAGKGIRLWDTRTFEELPPLEGQPKEDADGLAFSPDGKLLSAAYPERSPTVRLWDLTTRKEARLLQGRDARVARTAFSADGKRLALADGASVTFWDVAAGKYCHDFGHTYFVAGLAFSPDGKTLVTGASYTDGVIRLWDPFTGRELAQWHGHTLGVEDLALAPDGKLVASASQDGTVRLWDVAAGKELRQLRGGGGMAVAVAFAPDGKTLVSADKAVHVWDVATGREIRSFQRLGKYVGKVGFSPDGKRLLTTVSGEAAVRLWDVATGEEVRRFDGDGSSSPRTAFRPDGRVLAIGAGDGSIRLLDPATGKELRRVSEPVPLRDGRSAKSPWAVAFSPDGRTLAAGYADETVRLWEVAAAQERARFHGHRHGVTSLAFSPDGTLLASGSWDRTAVVWDLTGRRVGDRPARAHLGARDLNALWDDLADPDARKAYQAVQALWASGDDAVPFLRERLRPAPAVDSRRVARLVGDLDSDRFEVRDEAARGLLAVGELAEPALRAALDGKPSPEVRRRAEGLLEQLDITRSPEHLRPLRAVEALERIGSPDARRVLKALARGEPAARLTQDARAALGRRGAD